MKARAQKREALAQAVETVAWDSSTAALRVAEALAGAKAADDAFEAALVKQYRGKAGGPTEARYSLAIRPTWSDEVREAYRLKREADDRLRFFQSIGGVR